MRGRAVAILHAAATGAPIERADVQAFAARWLEYTGAALATRALEAGPFEGARVIELCAFVLRALEAKQQGEAGSG